MMPKFHNEFVKPDVQFSIEPKKLLTKSQTDEQQSLSDALQILSVREKTLTKKKPAA